MLGNTLQEYAVHLIRQTVIVLAEVIQDDAVAHAFQKYAVRQVEKQRIFIKKILKNHLGTQL